MNEELLKIIKEKGLLLEKDIFELLRGINVKTAVDFLEKMERYSGQKIITRASLNKNFEFVRSFVDKAESKEEIEKIFIKLGVEIEIRKEGGEAEKKIGRKDEEKEKPYMVFYANTKADKKIQVSDFSSYFRARYQQLQRMLMQRPELSNLASIGKISNNRQNLSIIGMVKNKRATKQKNIVISLEDLTGEIQVVVKSDRGEIFAKAEEVLLDDVIAVKASGNRDLLFAHEILFPDAFIHEKIKFENEFGIAFLSDIHCGSAKHLGENFERFIEWINSEDETAKKIKYLFFVGDNVDGVGIFPGQESSLALKSMKEQYSMLAEYLRKIPKRITMFMCPGQHDAVRVAEPQPIIGRNYASKLYEIENLVLVTNPSMIKLIEGKKEFKVLMYHGASIHDTFIREIPALRLAKAHKSPAKAVRHMLKRRHLGPTHSSAVYIPYADHDPLVIQEVPDVLCTGEVHRLDIENYNGVLIITGSCWQEQTPFEEKVGNIPDPCKVPVLNLKTRELKIFDFSSEKKNEY